MERYSRWFLRSLRVLMGARLITGAGPTDFNFSEELSKVRNAPETKPEHAPREPRLEAQEHIGAAGSSRAQAQ